ncbi:MAG: hypothetical protein AABY64_03605 [Bdellovibrionota bacterium]
MKSIYAYELGFVKLFAIFTLSFFTSAANASEYEVVGHISTKILTLDLKEKVATKAACDLYVQRFEYLADLKIINIDLSEVVSCPLDNIAARKARLDWSMPFNFSAQKNVYLRVNGLVLGTITINDQSVLFKPRGK